MEKAKEFYSLDENSQMLKRNAEDALYSLIRKEHFDSLLEIGCGNGHFLHRFEGKDVLGLDINQDMLVLAEGLEGKLILADISNPDFSSMYEYNLDVVASNYVFTELPKEKLLRSFTNIFGSLNDKGRFCFTITDPKTRGRMVFPGYKLVFDEPYQYEKINLPFSVLLQDKKGKYVDVGIRDYHNPIEVYDSLLKESGFATIRREDISLGCDCSYAVLYEARKGA